MVDAAERELGAAGAESPEVVIADAGYWHKRQLENVVAPGIQVLIPPDAGLRQGARPGWDGGLYAFMRGRTRRSWCFSLLQGGECAGVEDERVVAGGDS